MARINVRPSYASSRYTSATPQPGHNSDQENHDPEDGQMNQGKGRASDAPSRTSLPTPASDNSSEARGHKRKRAETNSATQASHSDEDVNEETKEEKKFNKYFDPNQDPEERREVKRKSRALERDFQERRDVLLRDSGDALTNTIREANGIYKTVKQTNDATLDSRLLVNVSDLANKKTAQLVLGDSSTGVDVDEFLSKCITYMRNGGPLERNENDDTAPSSSRRRQKRRRDDSDDEGDDELGGVLDWEVLGRHACFPYNVRPCVPTFLLGPLSVEKKQRTQTQRRARQSKDTSGREARPEALSRADLSQSDENGLTAICTKIRKHLVQHTKQAERALEQAGLTSLQSERGKALMKKYRIASNGGVSLFDYVVNPSSFGQTVENLFYVSFLIKEGSFGIANDDEDLPTLFPSTPRTVEEQRAAKASKHQAVFSLDYATWQSLIDAFDVKEPLIPHRQDEPTGTQIGQRGWYT